MGTSVAVDRIRLGQGPLLPMDMPSGIIDKSGRVRFIGFMEIDDE